VGDAAILLAVFGRRFQAAGHVVERPLALAPLDEDDVAALVEDLAQVASVRRDLEAGGTVDAGRLTRMERACIAALGRLGRVPRA
jgi:hypothetical protein